MTRKILQQAQDFAARAMGKRGRPSVESYGGSDHNARHRFDTIAMAEDVRLLREAGVVVVEGLATPASIAAQRATVTPIVQVAEPKPAKRFDGKRRSATGASGRVPTGWIAVHVPVTKDGRNRDRFEAVEELRDRRWFTELVSVGTGFAAGVAVHTFARPPAGEERPAHHRVLDLDRRRGNETPDRPPDVARSFARHGRSGRR